MSTRNQSSPLAERWGVVLALAGVLGTGGTLLLGRALSSPLRLAAGGAWTEAPNHLWTLAVAAGGVWRAGPFQFITAAVNYPAGLAGQVMDPINLLWFLPAWGLAGGGTAGATLGYNAVVLCNLLLAMLGGYRAGRYFSGHATGGVVAAAVLVLSAPFLSLTTFGFTEHMPIGWLAWHMEALDRALRGERRQAGVAAATLVAVVWSGAYLALAAAIQVTLFTLLSLWRRPSWRSLLTAAIIALVGLAAVAPSLWSIGRHQGQALIGAISAESQGGAELDARGRDLADLLPHLSAGSRRQSMGVEGTAGGSTSLRRRFRNPAWFGGLATLLALLGLLRAPRRAWPWWGLVLVFFLLHLGSTARLGGEPLRWASGPIRLPVYYMVRFLPRLGLVSDWGKLGIVILMDLAIASSLVVASRTPLLPRLPGPLAVAVPLLLVALLAVETHLVAQPPSPARTFSIRPPEPLRVVLDALPQGPVLQLPFDNQPRRTHPTPAYSFSLWQLGHRRAISENDEGPDAALLGSPLLRALEAREGLSLGIPQAWRPSAPSQRVDSAAGWRALAEAGFVAVVLHRRRARQPDMWERALRRDLGPPLARAGSIHGWVLEPLPTSL